MPLHRPTESRRDRAVRGQPPGAPRLAALVGPLVISLVVALVPPGDARAFSDVVFFGDSLTDTGNTCAAVSGLGTGFAPGRCSNGPVWSDYLVTGLGLGSEATSSASGGSNYANGGARTTDLVNQIDAYMTATGGAADADALHVIWLGGNDALFEVIAPSGDPGAMQAAAARIGAGIEALSAAGARRFLVANAPDPGLAYGNPVLNPPFAAGPVPFSESERAFLTGLALDLNTALDDVLGALGSVGSVISVDVFEPYRAIVDDPESFGFSADAIDTTSQASAFPIACLVDPVCAADPQGAVADGFIVFDSVHPTSALHRLIASEALAAVVPEPTTALCVGLGLALLGRRGRRRR